MHENLDRAVNMLCECFKKSGKAVALLAGN